jgi:hypothetical protein
MTFRNIAVRQLLNALRNENLGPVGVAEMEAAE